MEYCAACDRVLGPDVAPMALDDALADGQPQAGASLVRSLCKSLERYEDCLKPVRRYAGAVVSHFYVNVRGLSQDGDVHPGAIRAKLDRVSQEIEQHLDHLPVVQVQGRK